MRRRNHAMPLMSIVACESRKSVFVISRWFRFIQLHHNFRPILTLPSRRSLSYYYKLYIYTVNFINESAVFFWLLIVNGSCILLLDAQLLNAVLRCCRLACCSLLAVKCEKSLIVAQTMENI